MIISYGDDQTQAFANGENVKRFEAFSRAAERKLALLDAATTLEALRLLPGNRLKLLKGRRRGQWSIRINDQWRICFRWNEAEQGAEDVEITDYHDE